MIDRLVDATARHEMISFLDCFLGFNHILMHSEEQKKKTFMTKNESIVTKSCISD